MNIEPYKKVKRFNPSLLRMWLTLLAIVVLGVGIAALFSLAEKRWGSETHFSIVFDTQDDSEKVYRGSLNGVPIEIPSSQTYFAVEYKDTSIWSSSPKERDRVRTFEDEIEAFSLEWPKNVPSAIDVQETLFNDASASQRYSWMRVAVGDNSMAPRPPETPDNGLARVLRGQVERLGNGSHTIIDPQDPEKDKRIKVTNIHYTFRGVDHTTGLQWAEPVGPGTERFYIWNMTLYWLGDKDSIITNLISCYNGELVNPDSVQRCHHRFELPELSATVSLTYPRSWLPYWRQIRSSTEEYVLGFPAER